MKSGILSFIKFFIGWPLSVIALLFIFKTLGKQGGTAILQLSHANIFWLVISAMSFLCYFFVRSFFWKRLLNFEHHRLPYPIVNYLWEMSEIKRFIPGNIWSFLGRATSFSTKDIPQKTTAKLLIVEIIYIFIGSSMVSLLSLPLLLSSGNIVKTLVIIFCIAAIVTITAYIFQQKKIKHSALYKKITPLFLFSKKQHLELFILSSISFLFFGFGMLASTLSLFTLPLEQALMFVGLFSFSFLIGYASIITPMGLGVREAVATWGLSFFLPVGSASLAAIFGRIFIIITELIFFFLSFFLYKFSSKFSLINLKNRVWEIVLGFFVFVYVLYYTTASFLRYVNFYTGRFDLGNMDQTVWNTIHGRIFEFTNPDGTNIISRLSFHADFILVLLAPFYLLWQDARMLLLIQTIILAIGAIFVYLLAKDIVQKKILGVLFAFIYLINSSVGFSNLYDFHAVTLATTFLLGAVYFLKKRKFLLFSLFLLLAGITKEEVWIVTALLGIYAFFTYNKKLGAIITIASSIIFVYVFFVAIPKAHGGSHFALAYYSDYGSSPSSIIKTLIFSPLKTLSILTAKDRVRFLIQLLLPLGFLSLASPFFLVFLLPDLLIDLLSSNAGLHQIYYQYTAILTPFLFISAIYGYKMLSNNFSKIKNILPIFLICAALLSAYLFGPFPLSKRANVDMFTKPLTNSATVDDFLDFIPAKYSIAATNNLGSHLSHRQKIYTIPTGVDEADVVVFLLNDRFAQPSLDAQKQMAEKLTNDPNYVELFRDGDFVAFAKKSLNFQKRLRKEQKYFPFIRQLFLNR